VLLHEFGKGIIGCSAVRVSSQGASHDDQWPFRILKLLSELPLSGNKVGDSGTIRAKIVIPIGSVRSLPDEAHLQARI
jgi:hypothetical protein